MISVAVVGALAGYRMITGRDLVSLTDLGVTRSETPPAVRATPVVAAAPTTVPTATPPPAPTPTPTATPEPEMPEIMAVGNTDGVGAFLRRTPRMDDRIKAWVDGTRMEILGPTVDGDGHKWKKVRAPDGVEGYIPESFLVEVR